MSSTKGAEVLKVALRSMPDRSRPQRWAACHLLKEGALRRWNGGLIISRHPHGTANRPANSLPLAICREDCRTFCSGAKESRRSDRQGWMPSSETKTGLICLESMLKAGHTLTGPPHAERNLVRTDFLTS